ncbi:AAEL013936-PA [Aedes aegypti]|uniref:AAEL013936-PA n=1 Tax=Aedes aegypti TaxID=7159 RepID=Q16HR6_AEDAE|nr:AAEL013936-PA [Aedes aegypti]
MRFLAPLGIVLLAIVSHCQGQGFDPTVGATPENLAAVSQSVTNLAQKISLAIANPKSKTEIFSPVSIAGALSLLLLGSGGNTRDELMNVMGFQHSRLTFTDIHKSFGRLFQDLSSHFISVANGVFVDNSLPLNPRYAKLTKELYGGEIAPMALYSDPVRSSNFINSWVQEATRNKIQRIVSPEQVSNAPMVLVSALYFKAKWETMFIEQDTRLRQFYPYGPNAAPVDVESMATNGCFPFYEDKQLDAKIAGLPYQEGKSTMYIILPNESNPQKLRDLQTRTTLQYWDDIIDQMVVKTGTIILPKMKIENSLGLRDVLASLGLRDVFIPERSNLNAITKDDPILNDMNRRPAASQPARPQNPVRQPSTTPPNTNTSPGWTPPIRNEQKVPMPLNSSECEMCNNCLYEADQCICNPNQQIDEQSGCYRKPMTVKYSCVAEKILYSVRFSSILHVCLVEGYDKTQQCTRSCRKFRDECFCCRGAAQTVSNQRPSTGSQTTQQPEIQSGYQPVQQQGTSNQPTESPLTSGDDIGTRFNSYEPPNTTPLVGRCQTIRECNSWGRCRYSTYCALVNSPKRSKRQAVNSQPAKLFVGDVLHKVSLDVNEQGTEGGAVTAVVVDRISSSFNLRVNGPFLIYLRNEVTKVPLFYGAIFDPRP